MKYMLGSILTKLVFRVLHVMGVISREKAKLAAYKLKDVSEVWFEQSMDLRPIREGPVDF